MAPQTMFRLASALLACFSIALDVRSVGGSVLLPAPPLSPGRQLYVRSLHGVDGFQSDLYEILMEPYGYALSPLAAVAVLAGSSAEAEDSAAPRGELLFTQAHPPLGPVHVRGNITGLTAGRHGLHVLQSGDLRAGCGAAHFNPHKLQHGGGPGTGPRHAGDLGNVEAGEDGVAKVDLLEPAFTLAGGARGVVGRAVQITAAEDDLGRGGTADSIVDGSSGKAVACGVIAYLH